MSNAPHEKPKESGMKFSSLFAYAVLAFAGVGLGHVTSGAYANCTRPEYQITQEYRASVNADMFWVYRRSGVCPVTFGRLIGGERSMEEALRLAHRDQTAIAAKPPERNVATCP